MPRSLLFRKQKTDIRVSTGFREPAPRALSAGSTVRRRILTHQALRESEHELIGADIPGSAYDNAARHPVSEDFQIPAERFLPGVNRERHRFFLRWCEETGETERGGRAASFRIPPVISSECTDSRRRYVRRAFLKTWSGRPRTRQNKDTSCPPDASRRESPHVTGRRSA